MRWLLGLEQDEDYLVIDDTIKLQEESESLQSSNTPTAEIPRNEI